MVRREQKFVDDVKQYWRKYGRHDLPWRQTDDPYHIHVSEVMLQQTQVERVRLKYEVFLRQWPTVTALAKASLGDVLRAWEGLGYNSRAKRLQEAARAVVVDHQARYPQTFDELRELPGIGPYTAGAIMAFAFNKPAPIIETNIRTVFLHHFFNNRNDVAENEILQLVERTLDRKKPREWYWALMDYGAHLKKEYGNPNHRSRGYAKQSKFEGSDRQIRGAIVRFLKTGAYSKGDLVRGLKAYKSERTTAQLEKLVSEGMVEKAGKRYQLPT